MGALDLAASSRAGIHSPTAVVVWLWCAQLRAASSCPVGFADVVEACLAKLESSLDAADEITSETTRMAARWQVAASLRKLNTEREVFVQMGNHLVRPFSVGTLRRASAQVYGAILAQMHAFIDGIRVEVSPHHGSAVRSHTTRARGHRACVVPSHIVLRTCTLHQSKFIFTPGVNRCPLLREALEPLILDLQHGAEVSTPPRCSTLAAEGAAIWNAVQVRRAWESRAAAAGVLTTVNGLRLRPRRVPCLSSTAQCRRCTRKPAWPLTSARCAGVSRSPPRPRTSSRRRWLGC